MITKSQHREGFTGVDTNVYTWAGILKEQGVGASET